jgi:hypothetical protein
MTAYYSEWDPYAAQWLRNLIAAGHLPAGEPGTFPLAHGIPGRVGRLRAYGNAICPQAGAEVIGAFLDWETS